MDFTKGNSVFCLNEKKTTIKQEKEISPEIKQKFSYIHSKVAYVYNQHEFKILSLEEVTK